MLLELAVAATLLGTLLVVSLQLATALAAQRHVADQRQIAILEMGNVLERVASRPWAELKQESAAAERISPMALRRLPAAELKVEITESTAKPPAKRIAVSLRWKDGHGQMLPPMTVTTWKWKRV
jgi:hypothetical protein